MNSTKNLTRRPKRFRLSSNRVGSHINRRCPRAFSLVELLVGIAISSLLIVAMLSLTTQLSTTVLTTTSKMDAFQSAQAGFDIMTQKLADATLNTYYDYATNSSGAPTAYIRKSDLHFYIAQNSNLTASGSPANPNSGQSIYFQSPEGYSNTSTNYANTPGLLNGCGYFVQYGPDTNFRPKLYSSGTTHYRYRLMQAIQSTESNGIYADLEGTTAEAPPWTSNPTPWINALNAVALPIAENIIALYIVIPAVDTTGSLISKDYQYNSRQGLPPPAAGSTSAGNPALQSEQMPPVVQVTMVAIDSAAATRLDNGTGTPPSIIENALNNGQSNFTNPTNYATDLSALEAVLIANHIRYQILTTSVTLRESNWSIGQ